jgi:hypothetical protein
MPYKPGSDLSPEERYLTAHIRGQHGLDELPSVEGSRVYDPVRYARVTEMESRWAQKASEDRERMFREQGEEYHDLFGVADKAPFRPMQN